MSLDDLYQSLILDHNRRPRNQGPLEGADREVHGHNPLCGDQVTIRLRMDGSTIADVRFEGSGCAISKASASMMTTAVKGRSTAQALSIFDRFHELVTGTTVTTGDPPTDDAVELPKGLAAFAGVARFPLRVKCATMAWHALRSALVDPAAATAAAGDAASGATTDGAATS
jgi:nitrogen fixation NifU-like protein